MNLELFLAKRIHFNKGEGQQVSPPAIKIAIAGIAIGLAVMIISVAIVIGFKNEIRHKVIGFGSHIQVTNFDSNTTYETHPIAVSDSMVNALLDEPDIVNVSRFATKPGIIKTDSEILATVFKGVGYEYNPTFFQENIIDGSFPVITDSTNTNQVLISKYMSDKLHLNVGDGFLTYFIDNQIKMRKFSVSGIYQTNFTDYDKIFIIGDLNQVRKIGGWKNDQVSGIEIMVDDYDNIEAVNDKIYFKYLQNKDAYGASYFPRTIKQLNPQLFSWLDLLDMNVWIILILMALVSAFTMISGLLIIILERTNMIGILKALGYGNNNLRGVFLYLSLFLIGKGLLWGNIAGIGICLLQKYTKFIRLDPDIYYLSSVPVEFNIVYILLLNIGVVFVSLLVLLGPSYLVSLISPAKSIKYE